MRERGGRVEGTESGKQNDSIVASISQAKFYARYSPDLLLSTCSPLPPPHPSSRLLGPPHRAWRLAAAARCSSS